jgi:hypothetical protein
MKASNRINAADVTRRPVFAIPSTTALGVSSVFVVGLAHPGKDEHLVVHRQAVQERERRDRHPGGDHAARTRAGQQFGADAVLSDDDGDAVRGADRQRVEHERLHRQHNERSAQASSRNVTTTMPRITRTTLP